MRLKPYPAYKATDLAWLPEVPQGWEMLHLRQMLKPFSEKGHPKAQLLSVVRDKGVIVRDMENDEENHNFIPDDLSGYKFVRKGQFAMNKMKAWQGSYGVSDHEGIVSPAYFVFDLVANVLPRFFHTAIRSSFYVPFFGSASDGIRVGQWDLSIPRMKEIPFFVPPRAEQEAIVAYLDGKTAKIDRLIGLKEREIKLLNEKKQAVISKVVTRGLDPNAELVDSGVDWIGKVPRGWKVLKLSHRYSVQLGKMLDASKFKGDFAVPYLRNQDVQWDYINTFELPQMDIRPEERERFSAKEGDLLLCEGGEIGRCCVWDKKEIVYFQKAIMRLRPHDGSDDCVRYLWHLLRAASAHSAFVNATGKATIAHLPAEKLSAARLSFPPLSEQREIVAYLDAEGAKTDKAIAAVTRQIGLLKEYRTRLISDAVTGRIDLRKAARTIN